MRPPGQRYIPSLIVYRVLGQPKVTIETYKLVVSGAVERTLVLSYEELLSLPRKRVSWDFHCVTGWSVNNVEWEGVELKDLLSVSRPLPSAEWLLAEGLDGYSAVFKLEDAIGGGLVALRMNGEPLPPEHGFPARLVFKELYGWKGVKYLASIRVLEEYVDGYWERLGYHERGRVLQEERFKL